MKLYPTKGIVPPMVTPLLDQDTLDVSGLENLIEHLISGGVHGLFVLGTTGEGPGLSYRLRKEMIRRTCSQTDGRVPVWVGVTDASLMESVNMAAFAKKQGADGLVLAPPFYFNITEIELKKYMNEVLKQIELPLYLYNLPPLTQVTLPLPLINELARRDGVAGVKDSSGDLFYFHKLNRLANRDRFSLFVGPEELLMETLLLGGDGGVPGGANIFPKLYVDLYEQVEAGNIEQARNRHDQIVKLSSIVYSGPEQSSGKIIAGIKQALSFLDICRNTVSLPLQQVTDEKAGKIRRFLDDIGY